MFIYNKIQYDSLLNYYITIHAIIKKYNLHLHNCYF